MRAPARVLAAAGVAAVLAGCSGGGDLTGPQIADNVSISVTVPGGCVAATCAAPDPGVRSVLGLIQIRNSGTADAFLVACGAGVRISEAVFKDGQWLAVGPAVECAFPSTPIRLAAGQTLQLNGYFEPGWRRLGIGVATDSTLSDESASLSTPFRIF